MKTEKHLISDTSRAVASRLKKMLECDKSKAGLKKWNKEGNRIIAECDVLNKKLEEKMSEGKPKLELSGVDGNAFVILGEAQRVAKQNDMDWDAIREEAESGDYDNLLQTLMKYFDVV